MSEAALGPLKSLSHGGGASGPLDDVPQLEPDALPTALASAIHDGWRLAALFGVRDGEAPGAVRVTAVVVNAGRTAVRLACATVVRQFPSFTAVIPQAARFERELAECWGLVPVESPDCHPLRLHHSYRPEFDAWDRYRGETIVPPYAQFPPASNGSEFVWSTGPMARNLGEWMQWRVVDGEIRDATVVAGFQHRGLARSLWDGPTARTPFLIEAAAGDASVAHAAAYAEIVEQLTGQTIDNATRSARAVGLACENLVASSRLLARCAVLIDHNSLAMRCDELRQFGQWALGEFSGSRTGRAWIRPGRRLRYAKRSGEWKQRMTAARALSSMIVGEIATSEGMAERCDSLGVISSEAASRLGLVGPTAWATGISHPKFSTRPRALLKDIVWNGGVLSRMAAAAEKLVGALDRLAAVDSEESRFDAIDDAHTAKANPAHRSLPAMRWATAVVDSARGEAWHVAVTNAERTFQGYQLIDASFHNVAALKPALEGAPLDDAELIVESLGISAAGHDL